MSGLSDLFPLGFIARLVYIRFRCVIFMHVSRLPLFTVAFHGFQCGTPRRDNLFGELHRGGFVAILFTNRV